MLHGRARAIEVWRSHHLSIPVDLQRLVSDLELEIVLFPFKGRVNEMIVGETIGLRPGLPRPWFRWFVAHAVGHYVMHVGSTFELEPWQWVNRARDEWQAEEFAACLLGGPDGWSYSARRLGIPDEKYLLVQKLTGRGG
ncbi:MAG: hypothetical protein J4N30_05625 [Chloroflexi bacterium]|nr:hypothetical protein [Chloroflexota bacterium]